MAGNVLEFPGKRLLVEEACSGVQSLFAVVAAMAAYLVWQRRPWSIAALVLPAAVAAALVMNLARVTAIALAQHGLGLDLSGGWPHEALGTVGFALALRALAAVGVIAGWLLGPIRLPRIPRPGQRLTGADPDGLLRRGRLLAPPGFRALVMAERYCLGWNRRIAGLVPVPSGLALAPLDAATGVSPDTPALAAAAATPGPGRLRWLMHLPLALFGALAVVQLPLAANLVRWALAGQRGGLAISPQIAAWDAATLPAELGAWKRVEFERVERE